MYDVECCLQEGDLRRADQMFHIALRMAADLGKFQFFFKTKKSVFRIRIRSSRSFWAKCQNAKDPEHRNLVLS